MDDSNLELCESIVKQVWSDVLNVEIPNSDDNFFNLGGHSLLALTITSRLEGIVDCEIPLQLIFDEPILSQYSSRVADIISEVPAS